jgi:Tol biopolymer transport system component
MRIAYILAAFCAISVFALNCKDLDQTISAPAVDWEGNAPLYNEMYRDTIITLSGSGIMLIHKGGTGGRIVQPNASTATWSPRKWKILYGNGDRIFGYNLYFMNADGTDSRLVTTAREQYRHALMSPDGQKIAYVSVDSTDIYHVRGMIRVMNPDGTGIYALTSTILGLTTVAWTPDSREVVYTDGDSTEGRINIISLGGSGRRILYHSPASSCEYPSLSTDGVTLAFSNAFGVLGASKIVILDMHTLTCTQLTPGTSLDYHPSWSPDGKQLVYISTTGGSALQPLWRIDVDGQNPVCITTSYNMNFRRPDW